MLNKELTDSQKKELDRRITKYKEGSTRFYSWDEIKNELMKINRDNTSKKR
jgi:putative addiction module component (TIGR02574 family)